MQILVDTCGPFYCTIEVLKWKSYFIPVFILDAITCPYWNLKLIHVSKMGTRNWQYQHHPYTLLM